MTEDFDPSHRGGAIRGRLTNTWVGKDRLRARNERRQRSSGNIQPPNENSDQQEPDGSIINTSEAPVNHLTIDDIRFRVTNGGSKLERITGEQIFGWLG